MHPGSENTQAPFTAQRVIAGDYDRGILVDQATDNQYGQQLPEMINVPDGMAKEAVVIREVPVAGRVAGDNQIGNVSVSGRENPAGHQQSKRLKARIGEDWRKYH